MFDDTVQAACLPGRNLALDPQNFAGGRPLRNGMTIRLR